MTVVFGALTTQFTSYGTAVAAAGSSPEGAAILAEATDKLNRNLSSNVLYLVYIGIGMFV